MKNSAFEFINLLPDLMVNKHGQKPDGHDDLHTIDKLTCKYVVIKQNGFSCLVLGNIAEYPYHANLVDYFCKLREIASTWENKPDLVTIYDKETSILGGGWMEIKPASHSCRIFGASTAYGRYAGDEVGYLITSEPFFNQFNITLD